MNLVAVIVAAWIMGLLTGLPFVPLLRRIGRIGKSFFVLVNPRTKALSVKWAKHRGEVADFKFSDDTPKSVALDGPLSHSHKGARAFLVNTQAGVAFDVETVEPFTVELDEKGRPIADESSNPGGLFDEDTKTLKGKAGSSRTPHLNGARLNAIRKDTRVQQIA